MPEIKLTEITPGPEDALYVIGYVDGVKVEVQGWQSALTNHYDVDANGVRVSENPRQLTPDEIRAYCCELLCPAKLTPVLEVLAKVQLDEPPEPKPDAEAEAAEAAKE